MGSGTHDGTAEPRAWEINGLDSMGYGWDGTDGQEASQDDNHEIFFKLDSTDI